jgi:hypothetical protein
VKNLLREISFCQGWYIQFPFQLKSNVNNAVKRIPVNRPVEPYPGVLPIRGILETAKNKEFPVD